MKHLKLWTLPKYYSGAEWHGWYVFLGQNRDSTALERSNFECGLKIVKAAAQHPVRDDEEHRGEPSVVVVREGHFAVGWVEWIAVHGSDVEACAEAERVLAKLEDYPVVNEDHWSNLEYTEAMEYWDRMPLAERVEMCRREGESIFAARRNPPDSVYERLIS